VKQAGLRTTFAILGLVTGGKNRSVKDPIVTFILPCCPTFEEYWPRPVTTTLLVGAPSAAAPCSSESRILSMVYHIAITMLCLYNLDVSTARME
jgi:hypothetical protein